MSVILLKIFQKSIAIYSGENNKFISLTLKVFYAIRFSISKKFERRRLHCLCSLFLSLALCQFNETLARSAKENGDG